MSIELNKGLVLHQRLDQESLKSSVIFGDKTPYENDGTSAVNPPVFAADHMGRTNSAMVFNGSSDAIDCGNDASLLFGTDQDFSIACWIKYSTPTGYQCVFGNYVDGTTPGYFLGILNNEKLWFRIGNGAGLTDLYSAIAYDDGLWHFVVLTADRDGLASLYADDTVATVNISSRNGSTGSANKSIGNNIINWYFDGTIEDLRVYNRILTQEEATALYEMYRPGLSIGSLYKDLVLEMPLDSVHTKGGVAGSEIISDLTPYSNDGTNNGATVGVNSTSFDGISDFIDCGNDSSLDITGNITLSAWINIKEVQNNPYAAIIGKWETVLNERCYWLSYYHDFKIIEFFISPNGSDFSNVVSYIPSVFETWMMLTGVYNGIDMRIYENGILKNTYVYSGGINSEPNKEMCVGGRKDATDRVIEGNISKPKVWKRDLSAAEVLFMFEKEKGLFL